MLNLEIVPGSLPLHAWTMKPRSVPFFGFRVLAQHCSVLSFQVSMGAILLLTCRKHHVWFYNLTFCFLFLFLVGWLVFGFFFVVFFCTTKQRQGGMSVSTIRSKGIMLTGLKTKHSVLNRQEQLRFSLLPTRLSLDLMGQLCLICLLLRRCDCQLLR